MKKTKKILGTITLITAMVFSLATCGDPGGNNGGEPALTGSVGIEGTAKVGETLTAITTMLDGTGTITYQWKRGTTNIGINSDTYLVVAEDINSTITVTVTRAGYSGSKTSASTATVSNGGGGTPTGCTSHNWNWNTYVSGSGVRECQHTGCNITANVGDTGPAGGIIFYIDPNGFNVLGYSGSGATAHLNFTSYKAYYLEVAPDNTRAGWVASGTPNDLIPGLSDYHNNNEIDWAIGRGRLNTAIIIARGISQLYGTPAATFCVALETGGKNDWFLPSKNELNALSQIRGQYGIPNTESFFVSSSQATAGIVWYQNFINGEQFGTYKIEFNFRVRAVRAF